MSTHDETREELILEVASALHEAGAPAHRLEGSLEALAARVGLEVRVFSAPTSITIGLGPVAAGRTVMLRVPPGGLDLGRLAEVDSLVGEVIEGSIPSDTALARLRELLDAKPRWPLPLVLLGFGVTGAAAATLFGATLEAALASVVSSILVGLTTVALGGRPRLAPLGQLLAAFIGALSAGAWSRWVAPVDVGLVTLAALIVLVPGLSLTTALTELATRNLVSGTARFAGAMTSFAQLGIGALAGGRALSFIAAPPVSGTALPSWGVAVALPAAALSFVVLLGARARDTFPILLTSSVAYGTARGIGGFVDAPLDAAIAAFAVTLVANGLARWKNQPAALTLVPGLFLLVPGSTGFRGLVGMLDADVLGGMNHAVTAFLTAAALAGGILFAQAALPTKRSL